MKDISVYLHIKDIHDCMLTEIAITDTKNLEVKVGGLGRKFESQQQVMDCSSGKTDNYTYQELRELAQQYKELQ